MPLSSLNVFCLGILMGRDLSPEISCCEDQETGCRFCLIFNSTFLRDNVSRLKRVVFA